MWGRDLIPASLIQPNYLFRIDCKSTPVMDRADIMQCRGNYPLLLMAVQSFQKGCDSAEGVVLGGGRTHYRVAIS